MEELDNSRSKLEFRLMKPLVARLLQTSTFVVCSLVATSTARGQVTPDNTLGDERTVVTPNVEVKGIENILSPVTSGNVSDIFFGDSRCFG